MRRISPRAFWPAALSVLLTCSDGSNGGTAPPPAPPAGSRAPNIIFIMSDDEDIGIHSFLPKTKAKLQDRGTILSNFFVTYSLCCPSRASILRGQYPHNTKVESNSLPAGGYLRFRNLGREQATIATWLKAAGYRTYLAGKYMNGYGFGVVGPAPPGWIQWSAGIGDQPFNGFNYSIDENGTFVRYGSAPSDVLFHRDGNVFIVGGANSAGQAALHAADFARSVTLLVRGPSLADSMSQYLVERCEQHPRLAIRTNTTVCVTNDGTRAQYHVATCGGVAWTGIGTDADGNIRLANDLRVSGSNHLCFNHLGAGSATPSPCSANGTLTVTNPSGGRTVSVIMATTGRVRVKVDGTKGPIHIGDLLVTSDVPGVAMKSEAVNLGGVQIHRPGTLIGKALEPLEKGKGEILVLLSLQ